MATDHRRRLRLALGREPAPLAIADAVTYLQDFRVLVTGAAGSIGTNVCDALARGHVHVIPTDQESCNVAEFPAVWSAFHRHRPQVVIHLAGAKHAPDGEADPEQAMRVNAWGTRNVLNVARTVGARVVTASTCKACDPETAYGASKLIAERMTLNAGQRVARFYNVVESCGNVFRLWESLASGPIPVTTCSRFFISLDEATSLVIVAATMQSGRYTVIAGDRQYMRDVAARLYPDRDLVHMPTRRGDREHEPRLATTEVADAFPSRLVQIHSPHDP